MSITSSLSTAVDGTVPPLSFGSFDYFCAQTALPLCSLVSSASTPGGTEPLCYGRNIDFITSSGSSYLLFEPATVFTDIVVLSMALTMILYIRSKYTAVGRKEIVMFFYMYSVTILLDLLLVGGIIPPASDTYKASRNYTLRLTTLAVFVASFAVAILTFLNLGGLSSQAPMGLFILYFIFPAVFTLVYVCLQITLVLTTLDDRWPLSDLLFGLFFFAIGLVLQFVVGPQLCELATHYVDGMFFGQICILLAVMLVYKFWDLITKEDLEFAVSGKANVWETRNPLLGEDDQDTMGVKNDLW
ncbi:Chitin synthase, class 7 [Entophlyctis luteolus]|nr:Chitin synthase, class 7 [Entophlyctis luteolus]